MDNGVRGWVGLWQQNYKYKQMDLGVLSLLKWSAVAGLTLLSYFKARRLANTHARPTRPHPNDPIITPLLPEPPAPPPQPASPATHNHQGLITYSQFVSIYQNDKASPLMEEEWDAAVDEIQQDAYKSEQFSTMGGQTRRETLSLPSEDLSSEREENFEQFPSTPDHSIRKKLQRQWLQRTKFLHREPNSAGKPKPRIRKERFAKRDTTKKEE